MKEYFIETVVKLHSTVSLIIIILAVVNSCNLYTSQITEMNPVSPRHANAHDTALIHARNSRVVVSGKRHRPITQLGQR